MKGITKKIVLDVASILEEKKAKDIFILDLRRVCLFTIYFLICSGTSSVHIKSVAETVEERLKERGVKKLHKEGSARSGWILLDYGDLIIHVFGEEERRFYNLERLWGDAKIVPC